MRAANAAGRARSRARDDDGEHGLAVEQQRQFSVHYKGHFVAKMVPDLIVAEKVIVDAKVVDGFTETHLAQMLGYLAITGRDLALLISFKKAKLLWKRVIRTREASE